jgi:hypothetical protein
MKRLLPLRVAARQEAERLLPLGTEKHESRIEHYLDLANVALSTKKKANLSSRTRKSA